LFEFDKSSSERPLAILDLNTKTVIKTDKFMVGTVVISKDYLMGFELKNYKTVVDNIVLISLNPEHKDFSIITVNRLQSFYSYDNGLLLVREGMAIDKYLLGVYELYLK
jgi:hypothetical protein